VIVAGGTWYPVPLQKILGALGMRQYQLREKGARGHTLRQKLLYHLCGVLVYLFKRAAYLPHDASDLWRVPSRPALKQPRIATCDLFDDLSEASVFPQVVTVQLPHMRTIRKRHGTQETKAGERTHCST
jgi:hypothetical protein